MNTTKAFAIATLSFFGWTAAQAADVDPAWMAADFIMEEVVVTAQAPASSGDEVSPAWMAADFVMEEVVVTAQAPAHLHMEEIVVTASMDELPRRIAARRHAQRERRHL